MLHAAYINALGIFISSQAARDGHNNVSCEGFPCNDGSTHYTGAGMATISGSAAGASASCFAIDEVKVDAVDDATGLVVYDCKVKAFTLDHAVLIVYDDAKAALI